MFKVGLNMNPSSDVHRWVPLGRVSFSVLICKVRVIISASQIAERTINNVLQIPDASQEPQLL